MTKITGSCFCGAVAYEAEGPLGTAHHCHCTACQKIHAAPFITTFGVAWEGFIWTKGADVVIYLESSPGKRRWFCPKCGSHLMADFEAKEARRLRAGCVDSGADVQPDMHIWVGDKADFFDFDDALPRAPIGRDSLES